jgi:hypothetical protein
MLVALLALTVSLAGVSYAAVTLPRNSVGSKQLQKNAVSSKKVKDGSLLASDFGAGQLPPGPTGPKGAAGAKGDQGVPGLPGTPAFAVVSGRAAVGPANGDFSIDGQTTGTFDAVEGLSPNVSTTVSNLVVKLDNALPAGSKQRRFLLFFNSSQSSVACTIPAGSATCNSGAATDTVPPGVRIHMAMLVIGVAGTSPPIDVARWGFSWGG